MIFIWFWYGLRTERLFGGSSGVGFEKGKRNSSGTCFWLIFLDGYFGVDVVLICFFLKEGSDFFGGSGGLAWKKEREIPKLRSLQPNLG